MTATPESPNPDHHFALLTFAKRLSQGLLVGLIVLYVTAGLMSEQILWVIMLMPCLSLIIFLPGMLSNHARSYDWLCFVILIHFTVAVTNVMSPSGAWNDWLQLMLSVVLFISAMMASRWQKAASRLAHEHA